MFHIPICSNAIPFLHNFSIIAKNQFQPHAQNQNLSHAPQKKVMQLRTLAISTKSHGAVVCVNKKESLIENILDEVQMLN